MALRAGHRRSGGQRRRDDAPHRALDRPRGAGVPGAWRGRRRVLSGSRGCGKTKGPAATDGPFFTLRGCRSETVAYPQRRADGCVVREGCQRLDRSEGCLRLAEPAVLQATRYHDWSGRIARANRQCRTTVRRAKVAHESSVRIFVERRAQHRPVFVQLTGDAEGICETVATVKGQVATNCNCWNQCERVQVRRDRKLAPIDPTDRSEKQGAFGDARLGFQKYGVRQRYAEVGGPCNASKRRL